MKATLSVLAFPVIFFGALWATVLGLETGLPAGMLVTAVVVPAIVAMAILEHVLPCFSSWNQPQRDVGTDTLHMLLTQVGVGRLFDAVALGALAQGAAWLAASMASTPWPTHWPLWVQFGVALLGTDLVRYWLHRASHRVPLLWRFHAVHHSPGRLYWLNAGRFHPLDELVHTAVVAVPLALLGAPEGVLALHFVYAGIHGMFQHSNIDLRLGPLNFVFPMAELHRWHHSLRPEEANTNFGNNVALWDLVFGTWYNPRDRRPSSLVGIEDRSLPESYLGQLLVPFTEQVSRSPVSSPEWVD